jgi:hypothetical protein
MAENRYITLNTWKRRILRKVYGPVTEQGVWRIRINQETRELYKTAELATDIILVIRLKWSGM